MCGICGFFNFKGRVQHRKETLETMSALISHRGPDDQGYYHDDDNIALAHRRLSIIDLSGGHQPMATPDGNFIIVYNGEIYNYLDLRQDLSQRGYRFTTHSDTEVILAGYAMEGESIFRKLNGMFALAIWDRVNRKLVLARDRVGIKPLYYSMHNGTLYFASEIKAIQAVTDQRTLDEYSFELYMSYGYVPVGRTLISGVECVQPGTIMTIQDGKCSEQVYWCHEYTQQNNISEPEYLEELEHRMRLSVSRRMMSEVEIGAFLSGGVDSSLIVALMAEMSSRPIKTFSIGFSERHGNEFEYSSLVARQFETDHTEVLYSQKDFTELLADAIWFLDEPLRHDACVPLLYLAREAKRKATVILTGEGSDELFLGYFKYGRANKINSIARWLPVLAPDLCVRRYLSVLPARMIERAVNQEYRFQRGDPMVDDFLCSKAPTWVEKLADVDCRHYLISLLMKQDKMTMAAAIESRVPFLDHEIVEWAHNLPIPFKLHNSVGKYLVKKLASRYFSDEFLHRTKMGFPVPIEQWMRSGPLREQMREAFAHASFRHRGYFNVAQINKDLEVFPKIKNHKFRKFQRTLLWRIFNFELWARMFLDEAIRPIHSQSTVISKPSKIPLRSGQPQT
jgi:asparagine synthase (glutamine-hydrolysing)